MNYALVMRQFLFLSILFSIPYSCRAGCYQRRLCCTGRNNTCKGVDDGISHLPTVSTIHNEEAQTFHQRATRVEKEYYSPHYESSGDGYDFIFPEVFDEESDEKIGKLVLPDIIEMEGSGADKVYERYGLGSGDEPEETKEIPIATVAPTLKTLIFGQKRDQRTPPEEITRYSEKPRHLLIRYSLLSKYMPLKVSSSPLLYEENRVQPASNLYYLESSVSECYCDEHCVALGDCCSDYTFVCPPRDCLLSEWDRWTSCIPDNGTCGIGTQKRLRHVLQHPERGGAQCPPLKEMRTCFVECRPKKSADDITTVALILDYKYNQTRAKVGRNNIYWDLPNIAEKVKKSSFYCVHYSIDWVNRNCVSRLLNKGLTEGSVMCAECQPEATYHRNNGRCASDLEDGDQGFWKLIGPQSCNGIWTRLNRTDHCQCQVQYPNDHPFLLV